MTGGSLLFLQAPETTTMERCGGGGATCGCVTAIDSVFHTLLSLLLFHSYKFISESSFLAFFFDTIGECLFVCMD